VGGVNSASPAPGQRFGPECPAPGVLSDQHFGIILRTYQQRAAHSAWAQRHERTAGRARTAEEGPIPGAGSWCGGPGETLPLILSPRPIPSHTRLGEGNFAESPETFGEIAVDTASRPHYNTLAYFRLDR
jgi:hypothetical protein